MTKKTFPVKLEELPVIGEFILRALKKDLKDFSSFSSVFTTGYLTSVESKNTVCKDLLGSLTTGKELKAVTQQLKEASAGLRTKLNSLEGYLILGAAELDISVADAGLKAARSAISKGNTEGVIATVKKILTVAKRNLPALEARGLNTQLTGDLEAEIEKIDSLNLRQNDLISERNRMTEKNTCQFNDLWDSLQPILKTAKAIYRGVDEVKLKDYTVTQLTKMIHAEGKRERREPENGSDE
jgi:hypothetical protein